MLPDDFCVFILSHGRPNKIYTLAALERSGYTGKIYIVIDDEDKTADAYKAKYGDRVVMFSKREIQAKHDDGINAGDRRSIFYARNACWDIARKLGVSSFMQLDDDYTKFYYTVTDKRVVIHVNRLHVKQFDRLICAMLDFMKGAPIASVALAQGGDFLGGLDAARNKSSISRKCMNSFLCFTDRRFPFLGKINEDVTAYVDGGKRGLLFFTILDAGLLQKQTQSNTGGMTDIYRDSGTYVKSFYSVMWAPSCVKIGIIRGEANTRLHHSIDWPRAVPKILSERYKKVADCKPV